MCPDSPSNSEWESVNRRLADFQVDLLTRCAADANDLRSFLEYLASDVASDEWPLSYRRVLQKKVEALLNQHEFDQEHPYGRGEHASSSGS